MGWGKIRLFSYTNNCCVPQLERSLLFKNETCFELSFNSPEKSSGMIVGGFLNQVARREIIEAFELLKGPKWVFAYGTCVISGGVLGQFSDSLITVGDILPVTRFLPGCPPSFDAIQTAVSDLTEGRRESVREKGVLYALRD